MMETLVTVCQDYFVAPEYQTNYLLFTLYFYSMFLCVSLLQVYVLNFAL